MSGSGNWQTSRTFEDVGVAVEAGIQVPSQFWSLAEMDQAYLIGYFRVKSVMAEYEHFLQKKSHNGK